MPLKICYDLSSLHHAGTVKGIDPRRLTKSTQDMKNTSLPGRAAPADGTGAVPGQKVGVDAMVVERSACP
jgi:hypothetical protein